MGEFAKRLKKLRLEHHLTQEELAPELEISRSTLGMYETGKREPDFETLEIIADFFNVDMNYLIGFSDDPQDWEKIGNEEGIFPPKGYEGDYEDFVKYKIYEQQDDLCDIYCKLYTEAVNYLKNNNCQVKDIAETRNLEIITPVGEHLEVNIDDLVYNFMIFGSSKPGIKKLITARNMRDLKDDEAKILNMYATLNKKGQDKVIDYAKDLSINPEYRKEPPVYDVIAANNERIEEPGELEKTLEDAKGLKRPEK